MNHDVKKEYGFQSILNVNRVVHEPARLLILAILESIENADFLFLQKQTGLTRGNLSSHLSKLETFGYIEIKKEFVEKIPRTLLAITDLGRTEFMQYCESTAQFLEDCMK